jgi:hypothetical protein
MSIIYKASTRSKGYNEDTKLRREEERAREVRTPIYTRFRSRVALAGPYGAVRGNARSGEGHVTARAVTLVYPTSVIKISTQNNFPLFSTPWFDLLLLLSHSQVTSFL